MKKAAILFVLATVYRRKDCVAAERTIVRVSHFPNITRAHALAFEVRRDLTAELRDSPGGGFISLAIFQASRLIVS